MGEYSGGKKDAMKGIRTPSISRPRNKYAEFVRRKILRSKKEKYVPIEVANEATTCFNELVNEMQQAKRRIERKDAAINAKDQELDEAANYLAKASEEIMRLRGVQQQYVDELVVYKESQKQVEELEQIVKTFETEIHNKTAELEKASTKEETLKESNDQLENDIDALKGLLEEEGDKFEELQGDNANLQMGLECAKKEMEIAIMERDDAFRRFKMTSQQYDDFKKEIGAEYAKTMSLMKDKDVQVNQLKVQLEQCRQEAEQAKKLELTQPIPKSAEYEKELKEAMAEKKKAIIEKERVIAEKEKAIMEKDQATANLAATAKSFDDFKLQIKPEFEKVAKQMDKHCGIISKLNKELDGYKRNAPPRVDSLKADHSKEDINELKAKLKESAVELQKANESMDSALGENKRLTAELQRCQQRIENMAGESQARMFDVENKWRAHIEDIRRGFQSEIKQAQSFSGEKGAFKQQIDTVRVSHERKIQELEKEISAMKEKESHRAEEVIRSTKNSQIVDSMKTRYEQKIRMLEHEIEHLNSNLQGQESSNGLSLKMIKERLESDKQLLNVFNSLSGKGNNSSLYTAFQEKVTDSRKGFEDTLCGLKDDSVRHEKLVADLNNRSAFFAKRDNELNETKAKLDVLREQSFKVLKENEELQQKLQDEGVEKNKLQMLIDTGKSRMTRATEELTQYCKMMANAKSESDHHKKSLAELKLAFEKSQTDLTDTLKKYNNAHDENLAIKEKLDLLIKKCCQYKECLVKLKKNERTCCSEILAEKEALTAKTLELETKLQESVVKVSEFADMEKQLLVCKETLRLRQEERMERKQESVGATEQQTPPPPPVVNLQVTIDQNALQQGNMQTALEKLQTELHTLKEPPAEKTNYEMEYNVLKQKCDMLAERRTELEVLNRTLSAENENLKEKLDEANKKIVENDKSVLTSSMANEKQREDMERQLSALKAEHEQCEQLKELRPQLDELAATKNRNESLIAQLEQGKVELRSNVQRLEQEVSSLNEKVAIAERAREATQTALEQSKAHNREVLEARTKSPLMVEKKTVFSPALVNDLSDDDTSVTPGENRRRVASSRAVSSYDSQTVSSVKKPSNKKPLWLFDDTKDDVAGKKSDEELFTPSEMNMHARRGSRRGADVEPKKTSELDTLRSIERQSMQRRQDRRYTEPAIPSTSLKRQEDAALPARNNLKTKRVEFSFNNLTDKEMSPSSSRFPRRELSTLSDDEDEFMRKALRK